MTANPTFFWYDLETFGLNPSYDRIAQFAGQRTDMNLNPVGDPVVLYCKPSMDYLPDPLACLITSITPQETIQKGLPEAEFIEKVNREFSVPNTCVCGFNSIRFDDEFIRNALYRNFFDPYEREWKNMNTRWDILDLVRAAHDLRPENISWPPKNPQNGNPVFKLTELTAANGIDQTGAHDAMVDVRATIAMARLIKSRIPRLFSYFFKLRLKSEVKNMIGMPFAEPSLLTCAAFTSPSGCTSLIAPITPSVSSPNNIICFDLKQDINRLLTADPDSILQTPGIIRVAMNKCPALSPLKILTPELEARLGISRAACMSRYEELRKHPELTVRIREQEEKAKFDQIDDIDFQLYDRFFPDSDRASFGTILATAPSQRLRLNLSFTDKRCPEMLWRHVCRNYPETLDPDNMRKWKSFCSSRLLCPPGEIQCDLQFYERKVAERLASNEVTPEGKAVMQKLREYGASLKSMLFS
ncbi:MAG: exodeoxyribonuclease I [Sphaerochaetaceae bacterium]|nr:exodeoxyribonuclease I [Sphaerochaetaceae bacterium]